MAWVWVLTVFAETNSSCPISRSDSVPPSRCRTAISRSVSGVAALEHQLTGPRRELPPATPLTEREIAVLHLLGGTLSLREIGQELFVSANTVKTHTQAIYRKLGVSSRTEAVEQGRELGI